MPAKKKTETSRFNIGDLVRLKSGGPTMTVDRPKGSGGGGFVVCVWFNDATAAGTKFPAEHTFAEDTLERVWTGPMYSAPETVS